LGGNENQNYGSVFLLPQPEHGIEMSRLYSASFSREQDLCRTASPWHWPDAFSKTQGQTNVVFFVDCTSKMEELVDSIAM
jgi:hypothetical protein